MIEEYFNLCDLRVNREEIAKLKKDMKYFQSKVSPTKGSDKYRELCEECDSVYKKKTILCEKIWSECSQKLRDAGMDELMFKSCQNYFNTDNALQSSCEDGIVWKNFKRDVRNFCLRNK